MEKLQYEKPELIVIKLNDDIILASGCIDLDCGDIIICHDGDFCNPDNCNPYSH